MITNCAAPLVAATPAGAGWSTAVVELIVKGGALGLALMLTWMSYQLFKTLLAQPTVSRQKVMLVVFFVFGTFGSLVGGALMHRWLTNPRVELTLTFTPDVDATDERPRVLSELAREARPGVYKLAVTGGQELAIGLNRLVERAREAARLQEIVSQYERTRAAASPEIGAEDAL
jgi:hypothetical protein